MKIIKQAALSMSEIDIAIDYIKHLDVIKFKAYENPVYFFNNIIAINGLH